MEKLTLEKRQLCDIQGRLFELALKAGYDCPFFIEAFMNSKVAAAWMMFMTGCSGQARNIFLRS